MTKTETKWCPVCKRLTAHIRREWGLECPGHDWRAEREYQLEQQRLAREKKLDGRDSK